MRIFKCLLITFAFLLNLQTKAQNNPDNKEKMQWFADAKLGIFIHWGIYSVNGISESWAFYNNYINHDNYMKQLNGFTAEKYNPQEWVNLIKESGAKYAVITTKHHDGISLWNSNAEKAITTANSSRAKKDLLSPFVAALKKSGLKTGLYYSLPDWSHPYYDVFTRDRKRYDSKKDISKWNQFINYQQTQLKELNNYRPDLYWFDGDWEHSAEEWQVPKIKNILSKDNPNVIFNSRLGAYGDYETPEQCVPVVKPNARYWELCYTMNDSWGYQPFDTHYKSSNMIIRNLVDCISMGGNLLLDIAPKPDGTIPANQVKILKDLGRWTSKHKEAIYATQAGIPEGHINAKTALSKDKKQLYIYVDFKTEHGILLSGIESKVNKVELVGLNKPVKYTKFNDTDYILDIDESDFDNDLTVLKVTFNDEVKLSDKKQAPISLQNLFEVGHAMDFTNLNYLTLAKNLNDGINIFKNTNLSADGLGFKSGISNSKNAVNNWVVKNAEALYNTTAGIPEGHYQGKTVLSEDKQTLYLFVEGKPTGPISIKGLDNNISRIRVVGEGTMLNHNIYNKLYWSKIPGIIYIDIPKEKLDKDLTVIAVLLDGPIKLYREKIGAIENNQ
ncbi:alpha-L-fucosidase [Pedobacter sp. Leaf132]|uniref:alpha-L-fucosidase n=1 Tax=Pedobacter sp. Leaf132 TaxID=2876557 RepID=UPI001E55126A|nr:alpha-L-fucosidase [Pedobacter sp. Leaf132]